MTRDHDTWGPAHAAADAGRQTTVNLPGYSTASNIGGRWRNLYITMSLVAIVVLGGCAKTPPREVVVATTVDRKTAEATLKDFAQSTGIRVSPRFESEQLQTADLTQRILGDRSKPGCDLFWDNDILSTLEFERNGALRPSTTNRVWHGIAPQARVLIVNTHQVAEARRPKSIEDLIDPQWYERCGIARPLAGSSATHAASLFQAWGDEKARAFFGALKRNARILPTDRQVAEAVAAGQLAFGLTDVYDATRELDAGKPVAIVYPDQGDGQLGTLFIPQAIALLKASQHPEAADQLLDYLLSPTVANRMGTSTSTDIRAMQVDFSAAANNWDAAEFLRAEFAP
jgi:iron(III) transport system substrate-binding protein